MIHDKRNFYSEPTHKHDYYELIYIFTGESNHIVDENTFFCQKGDMIFIPPGSTHAYFAAENMYLVNICFKTSDLEIFFPKKSKDFFASLDKNSKKEVDKLLGIMDAELRENNGRIKDQYSKNIVNYTRDCIIAYFLRNISKCTGNSTRWTPLLTYFTEHYNNMTIEEAAKLTNLSVSHFERLFRRDFSDSFHNYLKNYRIKKAVQLLETTDKSVGEIADEIGYGKSICHFYEAFKKMTGTSPQKYRKEFLINNKDDPTYDIF